MPKNQLFRLVPPAEVCQQVLRAFGLNGFGDATNFSRRDLCIIGCVQRMNELRQTLLEYYLPCKARTYLSDLNSKNVITVLRQLARLNGYSVQSREKYIKGDKFIIYQIIPTEHRKYQPMTIATSSQNERACTVVFD
jgi:hypothetical protein